MQIGLLDDRRRTFIVKVLDLVLIAIWTRNPTRSHHLVPSSPDQLMVVSNNELREGVTTPVFSLG